MQALKHQAGETASQYPGHHAGDEGADGVNRQQSDTELAGTKAGGKAGQAKDAAEDGAVCRAQEHGTQGHWNDDEGDLQCKDTDIAQRGVVEQQNQRRKQRKPAQTDRFLIQIHLSGSPYCCSALIRIQRNQNSLAPPDRSAV